MRDGGKVQLGAGPVFAFKNLLQAAIRVDDGSAHIVSDAAGRVAPESQTEQVTNRRYIG